MTPEEVTELIDVCAAAYRQQADPRDQMIWSAAVGDLPFSLARRAVVEWIRTSPYWPRPADLRERARLIAAQDAREKAKRGQIEARGDAPVVAGRTGADMVRHVLGRLRDAGSDPESGKYLGMQKCGDVAEEAVHEWLQRTSQQSRPGETLRTRDAKPNPLYRPRPPYGAPGCDCPLPEKVSETCPVHGPECTCGNNNMSGGHIDSCPRASW